MPPRGPTRTERDAFGAVEIPAGAYWGAHTARSIENFPISGERFDPEILRAYALQKKASAAAHGELGLLPADLAGAIARAADDLAASASGAAAEGAPDLAREIVCDPYAQGAGTALHMNVNEVLAARAAEILGGARGDHARVHPNDHVNLGQSTNDTMPTVARMAVRRLIDPAAEALDGLAGVFEEKARAFDHVVKPGRTHLQDAVPIRMGREFGAYALAARRCADGLRAARPAVEELGIGGTAVGTGLNADPRARLRVVELLRTWEGIEYRPAENLFEAMQSQRCLAGATAALRNAALEIFRITSDVRLLASGPATGLGEIEIPALQAGSSIMPGKVNPSMAEMLGMVCCRVVGDDATVAMAVAAGQLELNVFLPVAAHVSTRSLRLFAAGVRAFTLRCASGISAVEERCARLAGASAALATALTPAVGYARAAEAVREAVRTGRPIVEVVVERGLLSRAEAERALAPGPMADGGSPRADLNR